MAYTDEQIREGYRELRDKVVSARDRYEKSIAEFRTKIAGLDKEHLDNLGIVIDDLDARKMLPALYSEPFDSEAYEAQRIEANKFFSKIKEFKERLKEEAAKEMGLV